MLAYVVIGLDLPFDGAEHGGVDDLGEDADGIGTVQVLSRVHVLHKSTVQTSPTQSVEREPRSIGPELSCMNTTIGQDALIYLHVLVKPSSSTSYREPLMGYDCHFPFPFSL